MKFVALIFFISLHTASAHAQVLWSAGMEQGNMSEWSKDGCGGEFNSGTSNSVASSDVAESGSWSAKISIGTPSSPESGVRLFRWCESQRNQELYYSAWYYFPQHYDAPNWWNVWQWKSKTPSRNDAHFELSVGNRPDGSMYLYLYHWVLRQSFGQSIANIPVGRWVQIEAYHRCAADNSGHVTIWQDGELLFDVSGLPTRYSDGDCQWSVNNYSDYVEPNPAVVYIDDAAIGLTRIGATSISPPPTTETGATRCKPKKKCKAEAKTKGKVKA